jgi:hypothetical protein
MKLGMHMHLGIFFTGIETHVNIVSGRCSKQFAEETPASTAEN